MNAILFVVSGKTTKRKVALKLPCVLGRSREADVTVAHPLISRKHCELSDEKGLLMLRDLASLNGTEIGGRQITSAPLLPDAEFTIGPLTFRVQYEYGGDLESLPPTCYVDEATESPGVEFAEAAPDEAQAAPAAEAEESLPPDAASLDDSEIVEVPDFVALADADPDEVLPTVPAQPAREAPPLAAAEAPVEAAIVPDEPLMETLPFEPQEDDSALQSGGMKRQSPWAAETVTPQVDKTKLPAAEKKTPAEKPAAEKPPKKKPNYGDDIDPEFGSFLEDLR